MDKLYLVREIINRVKDIQRKLGNDDITIEFYDKMKFDMMVELFSTNDVQSKLNEIDFKISKLYSIIEFGNGGDVGGDVYNMNTICVPCDYFLSTLPEKVRNYLS